MRTQTEQQKKVIKMIGQLSPLELAIIKDYVEFIINRSKKRRNTIDPLLEFHLTRPEVEPTDWEKKVIKRAKRSEKTYSHDEVMKRYGL